jgi:DHA1 family multidrug resistance protein-like MFS transporter
MTEGTPKHATPSEVAGAAERRAVFVIVAAVGVTSLMVGTWVPFLPLYLLNIGARDIADAAFWVAIASTVQGTARFVAGPLWGMVADRVGRKQMYLRALAFSALTVLTAGLIQAPWQLIIALTLHGLFSGVMPAATALLSVVVPDHRVKAALSRMGTMQYLGMAFGPAVGAGLALAVGYRGVFFVCATVVVSVAILIYRVVPADRVAPAVRDSQGRRQPAPFRMNGQLALGIFIMFLLFALMQLRQVAAPVALHRIDEQDATALTGLAFTLSGLASALGIWMVNRWFQKAPLRRVMIGGALLSAASHLLLAAGSSATFFVVAFALSALLHATLYPLSNTLIALNSDRDRRGTAFGLATGAQALALIGGPMGAALIAATSLTAGFAAISALLLGLALLLAFRLREPRPG